MHVHTRIYVHTRMHVHTRMYVHTRMHVHTRMYVHAPMYVLRLCALLLVVGGRAPCPTTRSTCRNPHGPHGRVGRGCHEKATLRADSGRHAAYTPTRGLLAEQSRGAAGRADQGERRVHRESMFSERQKGGRLEKAGSRGKQREAEGG
jgi:hypothetical protein